MKDLGLLALRLVAGGLMAGHGAQKLFGKFGGYGLEGTGGWMESMGLKPGKAYATMAGASEFGSGVLTALGLGYPLGPVGMLAPMTVAARTVHKDKPIWATEGGAELPAVYAAVGSALALAGPGRYSLDRLTGLRIPPVMGLLALAGMAGGVAYTLRQAQRAATESGAAEGTAETDATGAESNAGPAAATQEGSVNLHAGEDIPVVAGASGTPA